MLKSSKKNYPAPADGTFTPLLAALLFGLVVAPFAEGQPLVSAFLVIFTLVAGIFAIQRGFLSRGGMTLALVLVVGLRWMAHLHGREHQSLVVAAHLAIAAYMFLLASLCIYVVLRHGRVTRNTIVGAVSGYLLIAFAFAFGYACLEDLSPGNFSGAVDLNDDRSAHIGEGTHQFLYYSFVVLTTAGFGDILPASPGARTLSVLEMVFGQLYLAAFVARLVGVMGTSDRPGGA